MVFEPNSGRFYGFFAQFFGFAHVFGKIYWFFAPTFGYFVLPVEVKANTQGSMQSLWIFMRMRKLHEAIRTSLENFGQFDYEDPKDNFERRHVDIVPLYALSNL